MKINRMTPEKNKRICPKGHTYDKSSDCSTCPVCEEQRKPKEGFLSLLSAPARRALEGKGITTPKQLARHREPAILALHGMGPGAMTTLHRVLKKEKLSFKK